MQDPVVVYPRGSVWGGKFQPQPILHFGPDCLRGVPLAQAKIVKAQGQDLSPHALMGYFGEVIEPPFNYFIRVFGFLKVGLSENNPRSRIGGIQTSCPGDIIVEAIVHGDRSDERMWHERFAPYHMRGEWFRITPEIEDVLGLYRGEGAVDLGPASIIPGMEQVWAYQNSPQAEIDAMNFDTSPYQYLRERSNPSASHGATA
jgi:hypothetical protein